LNWSEVIQKVSARSGVGRPVVERVLRALREVVVEAVCRGDEVPLPGVLKLSSRWRSPRQLRRPDGSRMRIDGRFVPRVQLAAPLRRQLSERTPQNWRDPRQQAAWRLAETLLGDLAAYHPGVSPRTMHLHSTWDEVDGALREAFPGAWDRVLLTWRQGVDDDVRSSTDHLLHAARLAWPDAVVARGFDPSRQARAH
jgi:nucleoid DNA-binding protein